MKKQEVTERDLRMPEFRFVDDLSEYTDHSYLFSDSEEPWQDG